MTLDDRRAADALIRLLDLMRETGRRQGRIEVVVNEGRAEAIRIVKISESEAIAISN